MISRIRHLLTRLALIGRLRTLALRINDSFWFRPALFVLGGIALADLLINVGEWDLFAKQVISTWLYNGGQSGARTLLGAIAGSAVGVAGTLFSITIATLTLASNQMGPRLLRNFTQDRGNQYTLGIFLGSFVYALIVLGSVRGGGDTIFVPHLAITGALILSLLCVATLIYFIHHIASRINADTVIEMVYADLEKSIAGLTSESEPPPPADEEYWAQAGDVALTRRGYIQYVDEAALADWAAGEGAALRLLVRPGDFAFPGATIAKVMPPGRDPVPALRSAITFGIYPTLSMDLEFSVNQLVDIAARALSPGINDPHTAMRVLDHLGAALCRIAGRHLASGVQMREGRVAFQRKTTDYPGLTDAMFHVIRQNSNGSPAVRIRMLEVLAKAAECETWPERLDAIERHGRLVLDDTMRGPSNEADKDVLRARFDVLEEALLVSRARA